MTPEERVQAMSQLSQIRDMEQQRFNNVSAWATQNRPANVTDENFLEYMKWIEGPGPLTKDRVMFEGQPMSSTMRDHIVKGREMGWELPSPRERLGFLSTQEPAGPPVPPPVSSQPMPRPQLPSYVNGPTTVVRKPKSSTWLQQAQSGFPTLVRKTRKPVYQYTNR